MLSSRGIVDPVLRTIRKLVAHLIPLHCAEGRVMKKGKTHSRLMSSSWQPVLANDSLHVIMGSPALLQSWGTEVV